MKENNDLVKERLKKLDALKVRGIDAYASKFHKEGLIADLTAHFAENKAVQTAGRLSAVRLMGKTVFADLKDESGRVQVYVKRDLLGDAAFALFETLDLGDMVGIKGELFKTKTGEITLRALSVELLSKSLRPMPEKWHGLKDVEVRYRQRYLDLISNDETKELFVKRSRIVSAIRKFLDTRGYLEVETPMMQPIPGGAAGKPFKTHHEALDMDLYLRVAPELYLKKLLVGGFDKVYEVNRSFRNEGISTRHNPEFTMLEVYTAYHDVNDVMDLTEALIKDTAQSVFGSLVLKRGEATLDLTRWERISFADIMNERFGIRPEDPTKVWVEKLKKGGYDFASKDGKEISRTQLINIVGEILEPGTGLSKKENRPFFVTDYFSELSPLAKKNKKNPFLSDRFELYVGGMEVANGYSEQNDPIEQRQRLTDELKGKGAENTAGMLDEDFLLALEHGMPPAGGLGIGVDRLVMLLTGQPSIREVILFPQMKPEKDG